ncbi:hypothetical protein [Flavobacterium sp. LC2016-12]|uniref:hypothetical protein n=1 Tax=Flavobacterium sp. LC2016-12 TaxID=2783794 RepID=UPI00188D4DF6|nr:hypothetical protein [Flavobacterium sp. LC2016-12]MBF4467023.1 hypothetical protein [Flavobacterium sp. LC2016-12]
MKQEVIKNISTESGLNEFQVRLLKNEGVGLLTTKKEENYLILDSIDYWYDLIQSEYPKKKKCSCKSEWFYVAFHYIPRVGTEDFREVRIITTCILCNKISKAISIDIDYSPTKQLIENPITFCSEPKIRYKFQELTSYWSGDNLKDLLDYIFNDLNLNVYCWFSQHPENKRRFEKVSFEKAIQIITVNHRYLNFYFSENELETSSYIKLIDANGIYLKDEIWRRNELIQLTAPYVMMGYGLLYYINFCNQYLEKGNVKDKSSQFETITTQLKNWLKEKFVTKRGENCFDGQEAYDKLIAKRNTKG